MKRVCLRPGCPSPAVYRGRCKPHSRKQDRQTNRAGRSVYNTKRWRILRRHKLSLTPLCQYVDPDEGPCMDIATDVHHRKAIAEGGAIWDIDNLEALCHRHHSMETRREQMAA